MNINHVLIQTSDLSVMTDFLQEVIGFEKGERPPFPFAGEWLYSEEKPLIHLVEFPKDDAQTHYLGPQHHDKGMGLVDHVAIEGADYTRLIQQLNKFSVSYTERVVPRTNAHQVFVMGPDNLKLEMLFDKI